MKIDKNLKKALRIIYAGISTAYIIVISICLPSCGPSKAELEARAEERADSAYRMETMESLNPELPAGCKIVKIDSCEYITFATYYGCCIIHKENCNNH